MKNITIPTPRLLIRSFTSQDAQDLFDYLSTPEVYRYEPGEPITIKQAYTISADMSNNEHFWAVELKSEKKVIGQQYFSQQEPKHLLTWELGYILNPHYQQQGYGSEAAQALVEYGFTELGAHRIQAHCHPDNTASWKLLEKIGFRREGLLRKNVYFRKDDAGNPLWWDSFAYAKLERKFE
jgi:RimJ/RimL family protein N-acetyltransferase